MEIEIATPADRPLTRRRSGRILFVRALGPVVAVGGLVWAIVQPYRITFLDPAGQGFWWLVSEPPLYVILIGVLYHLLVAPGVVEDIEAAEGPGRE